MRCGLSHACIVLTSVLSWLHCIDHSYSRLYSFFCEFSVLEPFSLFMCALLATCCSIYKNKIVIFKVGVLVQTPFTLRSLLAFAILHLSCNRFCLPCIQPRTQLPVLSLLSATVLGSFACHTQVALVNLPICHTCLLLILSWISCTHKVVLGSSLLFSFSLSLGFFLCYCFIASAFAPSLLSVGI